MKILKQASKGYLLNGIKCAHIHLGNCRHLYLGKQGLNSDLEVRGRICVPGTQMISGFTLLIICPNGVESPEILFV